MTMAIDTDIEKSFEGCRLVAYQDSVGVWTIGYGHTAGVHAGMTITQEQAEASLLDDLKTAITAVESLVHTPLTVEEESALVDLVFNIGSGNFSHSTLLKLLNAGDYSSAALEFDKWDRVWSKTSRCVSLDDYKSIASEFLGMDDGIANRMDRIKACGNAQVPECAAFAWRTLNDF